MRHLLLLEHMACTQDAKKNSEWKKPLCVPHTFHFAADVNSMSRPSRVATFLLRVSQRAMLGKRKCWRGLKMQAGLTDSGQTTRLILLKKSMRIQLLDRRRSLTVRSVRLWVPLL